MREENFPDWLPPGWNVQLEQRKNGRKVMCYFNSKTGQRFFSKNDIMRCVKMGSIYCDTQPINKHIKRGSQNIIMPLAIKTTEFPEWLPNGWILELKTRQSGSRIGKQYKCYLDPSTGGRFYSKPEVCRYLKSLKHDGCTSTQKKTGVGMPSPSKVVIERSAAEGLPEGWIKETKIRMNGTGIRRDPYYKDPLSGYVFRSRKDAVRYLETGKISRHAFKSKDKCINGLQLANNEISPSSAAERQNLMQQKAKRRLFLDTGSSDMSSLSLPEGEGTRKKRVKELSAENKFALKPLAETLPEKLPEEDGKYAESKAISVPNTLTREKDKDSKRKSKKELSLPCRSSNRLAGLEPDLVANSRSSGQARVVAHKMSGKNEAIPAVGLMMGTLNHTASCQLEVILKTEPTHHASRIIKAPLDLEKSKENARPLEDAVQGKEPEKLETAINAGEKTSEEPLPIVFPFGESWTDPCIEFAYKTLTGAIPIDMNMEIEGYFQQQIDTSLTLKTSSFTLPDVGLPDCFQSDISSQFDNHEPSVSRLSLASNPSFLPRGNVNLPSCSGINHQHPNLEGNKESSTKVN